MPGCTVGRVADPGLADRSDPGLGFLLNSKQLAPKFILIRDISVFTIYPPKL